MPPDSKETKLGSSNQEASPLASKNTRVVLVPLSLMEVHPSSYFQLTYSGGTDQPGELCYNFSIAHDVTQIVNLPTRIPHCNSDSPALLDLLLSPDTSIWPTMVFPPLGNSDHVGSVSIEFPSKSQRGVPFHCRAYDYSCADWDSLCDHLRDVPWEDIFKYGASAAASEFCEWVKVGIDVYIPHRNYSFRFTCFPF